MAPWHWKCLGLGFLGQAKASWTSVSSGPSIQAHSLWYDASSGAKIFAYGDTGLWQYTFGTSTWTSPATTAGTGGTPTDRNWPATAWNSAAGILWMFGGGPDGSHLNDLWTLDGSLTWNRQHDGTGTAPSARNGHFAAWDSTNQLFWMFGGWSGPHGSKGMPN